MSQYKSNITPRVVSEEDKIKPSQLAHVSGDLVSITVEPSNLAGDIMQIRRKLNLMSGTSFSQEPSESLQEHVNNKDIHIKFEEEFIAGEYIEEFKVVYYKNDKIWIADHTNTLAPHTIGVATQSRALGQPCKVRTGGKIEIAGVNFTQPFVYLGVNGELTEIMPTTGYTIIIGRVVGSNSIVIDIELICKNN